MNACLYMTGGCNPSSCNPETYLWGMPREIESHCQTVAVDANAQMMGIVHSWYPLQDISLIEAAYCPEVPEDDCVSLVADSVPLVEKQMEAIDVNTHHPPVQTYSGPLLALESVPVNDSENQAVDAGQSSREAPSSQSCRTCICKQFRKQSL